MMKMMNLRKQWAFFGGGHWSGATGMRQKFKKRMFWLKMVINGVIKDQNQQKQLRFAHLCDKQANGPKGHALSEFARMLRERF